ncbi:sensor histidine kinase [Marinomonas polaris]|uniref:sensor histidine kinase n=1 Tax=Marinomonas polaris TaxID=293552 RepID=UPI003F99F5C1
MIKMIFLKNKIIYFFVFFVFSLSGLIFYSEELSRINGDVLKENRHARQLVYSIDLMKISQNLIGLDKQRSISVFAHEYSRILREYREVKSNFNVNDIGYYSYKLDSIISDLNVFNENINIREDYIQRKNNLRVIVLNGIDLNEKHERIYLWKLLESTIEAKNLLELGELYREFFKISNTISIDDFGMEGRKIKNISLGSFNVFSTMEEIISLNILLNQSLDKIKSKTDDLSNDILFDFHRSQGESIALNSRLIFLFFCTSSFFSCLILFYICFFLIKSNKRLFLSLSDSMDVRSFDSKGNVFSGLNEKDLFLFRDAISNIVLERKLSYILMDGDDKTLYFSSLFYEQNLNYFSNIDAKSKRTSFRLDIHDDYGLISTVCPIESENSVLPTITFEIEKIKSVNNDKFKIVFIKSEVEEVNKQVERLEALAIITGSVAHDINNMISVIVSSLNVLRDYKSTNTMESGKVIDRALFSADKSISLIDRLLTFSRSKKLSPELINVNEILEGIYEVICFAVNDDVSVELFLSDMPLYTYIDAGQFETSIINLCINSNNAIKGHGKIKISSQLNIDDRVTIVVEDNGHGIPKNIQGRVFEPFFTGRKKGEGHGLGLSMVYGFVKQSGGSIFLESKVGFGTKISINFSLKKI